MIDVYWAIYISRCHKRLHTYRQYGQSKTFITCSSAFVIGFIELYF